MSRSREALDFFPIGSSYYPPFHTPDDWVRDVARMADAGLNALRTAELIASWEWIEPVRGQCDFGWLDRIFELCQQYGIRILLGTGAGSPPIWMLDEYPDLQIVSQDGIPYPTGAMWGWACIHNPGFLAESDRYLGVLLSRYGEHPSLLGWQIHNETGHPAISRIPGAVEHYCYCSHSAAGFRRWLMGKYTDVEALSEAWACTPTRHRYHDWVQVQPPRSAPTAWGSPGAWMDWRLYIDQSFADFIAHQDGIIKGAGSKKPTTTNLVRLMDPDFGAVRGIDAWLYPDTCDAYGFDLYPIDRFKAEPFYTSLHLDYARSPALHADKPFWIPEIESGPIGEWVLGPTHDTTSSDIRRYDLECIAHGAKMILYQGYREWDPLPLHWGALVDLNGEPTERYREAARVNEMVQAHSSLFVNAQPMRAQIGILVDQRNAIACHGMGAVETLLDAIKGAYQACWSSGYPVEFVTPELLAAGKGKNYRLLLMPFLMLVTPSCARAVADFVANGGMAVAFAKCGMLNEKSWYWHDRPGGMTDLFGVKESRISKSESIALKPETGTPVFESVASALAGYWHRQDFALDEGVDVLARYDDGAAAVIGHAHGKGYAILFGTHFDVAALAQEATAHRRVFANLARISGVARPFILNSDSSLDGHLLRPEHQEDSAAWGLFVLVNPFADNRATRVCLPAAPANAVVTDLFTSERMLLSPSSQGLCFDVSLDGYGSTAFLIA